MFLVRNEDVKAGNVKGSVVLLNISNGRYYIVDRLVLKVFGLCDGRTLSEIRNHHALSREERKDIGSVIKEMVKENLITASAERPKNASRKRLNDFYRAFMLELCGKSVCFDDNEKRKVLRNKRFVFDFYGFKQKHDEMNGKGSFNEQIAGIRNVKRICPDKLVEARLHINSCNVRDIDRLAETVSRLNVDRIVLEIDGVRDSSAIKRAIDTATLNETWTVVKGMPKGLMKGYEVHVEL